MEIELKEYLDGQIEEITKVCDLKHSTLERDRKERGEQISKMDANIDKLAELMNGKFTKMYYAVIGIFATTILTLTGIIVTLLSHE
jgi:hypothetical protein